MKPMTKEEWDARQSVIRRVVDPETGRTRYDPGAQGDGLSIPIHAEWAGGSLSMALDPGPLQQQRPEPTPHRSPLIRPGVTYPESDTMTPNH